MEATSKDKSIGYGSLTWTGVIVLIVCVTAVFCFGKMEKTTAETERVAQLTIDKNRSEAVLINAQRDLLLAKSGKMPESRAISFTDAGSHVLNTSYQASNKAQWNIVNFSVSINATLSLSGGQTGQILLQTSPDNVTFTTICTAVNGNTGALALGLNVLNSQTVQMIATVPPNYYYRLSSSGTATMAVVGGRELAF